MSYVAVGLADLATCEDCDPQCPHCAGRCTREPVVTLMRVDIQDRTGSLFCDPCSEEALESGAFTVLTEVPAWMS